MRKKSMFLTFFLMCISLFLFGCKNNKKTKEKVTTKPISTSHIHSYGEWKQIVKPTCTEEGLKRRTCSCGAHEDEVIPVVSHTYINDKCSICGHERVSLGFNIVYVKYSETDGEYLISGYTGSSSTVRIQPTYDDGINGEHKLSVDKILVNEEYQNALKSSIIKKIIIGTNYSEIDDEMFFGLDNLEEVVVDSNKLTKIGDKAFYNCKKLTNFDFTNEITQIGACAFENCNLKEFKAPYSLLSIGGNAFAHNIDLESVTLNNLLTSIGDNAFNDTKVSTIRIPYSLQYFGYQEKMMCLTGFTMDVRNIYFAIDSGCLINKESKSVVKASKNATIPTTVGEIAITDMEPFAFAYLDYSDVSSFVIPGNIEYIWHDTFYASTFNNIVFESGLRVIGENAFRGIAFVNPSSTIIALPDGVEDIGSDAFVDVECSELDIPITVDYLRSCAFSECKITTIKIHSTTLESVNCSDEWNEGIDTTITTVETITD